MDQRGIVLVTGSTEGIGKATVLELARARFRVLASGRNPEKLAALAQTAAEKGLSLETLVLDVTEPASIARAAREVAERTDGSGLDVLVNNAGYAETGPLETLGGARLRRQFETNVFGLMEVTRAFLPPMIARGAGRIVNVSSVAAHVTLPFFGAYTATKHAVDALSDALRIELADRGIEVVVVEPGPVRTDFTRRAMERFEEAIGGDGYWDPAIRRVQVLERKIAFPAATPEQVARVIVRAAKAPRPRARYVAPLSARAWLAAGTIPPRPLRDAFFRWGLRALRTGRVRPRRGG